MPKLLLENEELPVAVWRSIKIPPWDGELWLKVRPYTQALREVVIQRAKSHPLWRRHKSTTDGTSKMVEADDDSRNRARNEVFLQAVIEDWRGVEGDPPCDDEHKAMAIVSQNLVVHLSFMTNEMAGVAVADEEGN